MDLLLKNEFLEGKIIEICGKSGVGKSQLCFTIIANNFKKNPDLEFIYINTKNDFNLERFIQILNSGESNKIPIHHDKLSNIKIENIFTAENLLECLNELNINYKLYFKNLKIVIIDSLPSLFLNITYEENIKSKNFE